MKCCLRIPAGLFLMVLCVVGLRGCGSPVETGDPEVSLSNALAAVTVLEQMIEGGATGAAALQTLAQSLQGTPDVAEVLMEDNQDTLWVSYRSGLVHGFAVVDEEEEDQALSAPLQSAQLAAPADPSRGKPYTASAARSGGPYNPGLAQAINAGSCAAYGIPANNKAVIANSLTVSQPLQDFSGPLKTMLVARGYDVQTVDADLDFFKRLTEFGVIVIEAHGAVKPYFTVQDILGPKSTGADPTCSSQGGSMVLWTTTPVTSGANGNFSTYVSDVVCGRLRVVTTTVRRPGQKPFSTTVYGVTPNFVRKYAQGNFPSHTLLCLSACRGYDSQLASEWADLLHERCENGWFLGWTGRVHWAVSARAYLNLFQLMAGTNEEFTLTSRTTGTTYYLLERNLPPFPAQDLLTAWDSLRQPGYHLDPLSGSELQYWVPPQMAAGGYQGFMLAPDFWTLALPVTGPAQMTFAFGVPDALLRVGSQSLSIRCSAGYVYTVDLPAAASGQTYLEWNGRTGPPHDLLLWRPIFNVTGTGPHGMTYTITYTLRIRAMPDAYPERRGRYVFSSGAATHFLTRIDPQVSTVGWSVSGGSVEGDHQYAYSGGGLQGFSPAGEFESDDGMTARLSCTSDVDLPYTMTVTNLTTGEVSTSTQALVSSFTISSMTLAADWTVQGGSDTYSGSQTPGTITWASFAPTPLFDSQNTRR